MFLLLLHKYFKRCIYALSVILFFATLIFNGKRHKAKGKVLFRKTIGMRNWAIPEKIQTGKGGGWGHTFLKKNLGICRLVTLPLDISDKMKLHPWKFHKFVSHPKTRTYGNSAWLFLDYPWKFHHFLLNFHILYFQYPWKFHILNPPCLFFSGITHCYLENGFAKRWFWFEVSSKLIRWNAWDQFQTVKFKISG